MRSVLSVFYRVNYGVGTPLTGHCVKDTKAVSVRRPNPILTGSICVFISLAFCLSFMSCSSSNKAQGGTQDQAAQQAPQTAPTAKSGPQTEQDEKLQNLNLNPSRPYATRAIQIRYRADENLNRYEDKPHTLTLVVYQVTDIKWFNNNIKDAAGLTTLLGAEKPDPSVLAVDRFFIEPGEVNQIELDRYENAKWVAIVAGYYDLRPGQVTRSYELPVLIETKGTFFKTNQARMGALGMNLYFGPSSIQEVPSP